MQWGHEKMSNSMSYVRSPLLGMLWSGGMVVLGSILAAVSIQYFLLPNQIIDGGVIGVSLMIARYLGDAHLPFFLVVLTIPFLALSYFFIRRNFFLYFLFSSLCFASALSFFSPCCPVTQDPMEVVVVGGLLLGLGAGMVIRAGSCLDGTEILAILVHKKHGFTIGQVVLFINLIIFAFYGWLFDDAHAAIKSLITFFIVHKTMDSIIVGLEDLKLAMIMTEHSEKVSRHITEHMGLGLTIMYGRGGFSGNDKEILCVVIERIDLAGLKNCIFQMDPRAFVSVANIHEAVYSPEAPATTKRIKKKRWGIFW